MTKVKVGVVSLGCDKNRVDTEVMLNNLAVGGHQLVNDPSQADVIIVNTCAFLEASRKEGIDTIIEMNNYKTNGNCKKIVVTGCLGQKYGDELNKYLTEADVILGINQYDDIASIVEQCVDKDERTYDVCPNSKLITQGDRILTTLPHIAYVKIADGCDNFCSYCLIPYIRGRFRSRTMESIVSEVTNLVSKGVKEVILVAQDVTKYGTDLYGNSKTVELVQELSKIEGLHWIRLLYCYPELVTDQLIEEIANNPKVVKYIDIPLQHVDDFILKKMNRRCNEQQVYDIFDKLKAHGIEARTTFICGFPYETQQTHQKVADFLKKYQLRNVGFFAYSKEEGTSAYNMPEQVNQRTKDKMVKNLYAIQKQIIEQRNASDVDKTYQCVIDSLEDTTESGYVYLGRTQFMTPDIDSVVYINSKRELQVGDFVDVQIVATAEYDLLGEVK